MGKERGLAKDMLGFLLGVLIGQGGPMEAIHGDGGLDGCSPRSACAFPLYT